MPQFLLDHEEGCTPLKPCRSCRALTFLRENLKREAFQQFIGILGDPDQGPKTPVGLETPWEEVLRLPYRIRSCLINDNISTIGEIVAKTEAEMLRIPNFGRTSLRTLRGALASVGHSLKA